MAPLLFELPWGTVSWSGLAAAIIPDLHRTIKLCEWLKIRYIAIDAIHGLPMHSIGIVPLIGLTAS